MTGEKSSLFKVNLSRYVRDEVPGSESAKLVFGNENGMKGASLKKTIDAMMKSFGTDPCLEADVVKTWGDDERKNYGQPSYYLEDGQVNQLHLPLWISRLLENSERRDTMRETTQIISATKKHLDRSIAFFFLLSRHVMAVRLPYYWFKTLATRGDRKSVV